MIARLSDKGAIEGYLRRDPWLRLYEIGDLDNAYWPYTTWFGLDGPVDLKAVAMLFAPDDLPVLSALNDADPGSLRSLLAELVDRLPARFYLHLTPGLEDAFVGRFELVHHGTHRKMKLVDFLGDAARLPAGFDSRALSPADLQPVVELYAASYPGNWFDPHTLATGKCIGVFEGDRLVSIAGIHVFSAAYRVAVLGNITTHPGYRHRGLGTAVTALACAGLRPAVDHIGLNVESTNTSAIRAYEKVGFEVHTSYEEYMVTRR